MLNLILKLKSFLPYCALIAAILGFSYGWYWHAQYNKAQSTISQQMKQIATCKASQELLESGVRHWKAAAAHYDAQLKRKETVVAKLNKESKQRVKEILQSTYPEGCNEAFQQAIEHIKKH